ncbi:O-antigen ligase family protein [Polaribacter haliotis]|uniref:O-antigen ligase family protein n=1 Tax=Polaribacter haliotis TaxID=1888915 RepID=A0A7L8AHN8_9FLAO|nr:O-antigen ligase family protein [Polaribacter haliotis]QOD61506.1 O-antigen ligase family protein [Polaribacter haliotis]
MLNSKKNINKRLLLIGIHIVIGFLGTIPIISKLIFLTILFYAFFDVFTKKNSNNEALLWSAYFVGAEVFIRMTGALVFYETGKIYISLLLILGYLIEKFKNVINVSYVFYLLLLLLGIVFTRIPEGESLSGAISFNLSGPISLGIVAIHCYKRVITNNLLKKILFYSLLPIFSMVMFMYYRTPDLSEIVFTGSANYYTSGGFGPNQVATVLGYGIFILGVFIFFKIRLTGSRIVDSLFLIYFIYRGLLTFSRGGIITAGICLAVLFLIITIYSEKGIRSFAKYIVMIGFFVFGAWLYTSGVTGGMLDNRYAGKNAIGVKKEDITSGRIALFENQLNNFLDSPILGIGVGNGKYKREMSAKKITAASHNELTRLIEEHGIIGVFSLLILFFTPLTNTIFNGDVYQRAFLFSFFIFWFLTINHSAMRIAFPAFIYGMSLIKIEGREYV